MYLKHCSSYCERQSKAVLLKCLSCAESFAVLTLDCGLLRTSKVVSITYRGYIKDILGYLKYFYDASCAKWKVDDEGKHDFWLLYFSCNNDRVVGNNRQKHLIYQLSTYLGILTKAQWLPRFSYIWKVMFLHQILRVSYKVIAGMSSSVFVAYTLWYVF